MTGGRWRDGPGAILFHALQGDGPQTLVMLHELGGDLHSFDALVPALGDRFRTLRIDLRGAGRSETPRAPFTIEHLADDVLDLLAVADLRKPAWLLGAAAGAAVAVACARRRPDAVRGLVLCGPALQVDASRRALLEDRADRAEARGMRAVEEETLARSYPPALRADAARFEAYRHRFLCGDPLAYAFANRALAAFDPGDPGDLALPCLAIAGTQDLLRPPATVRALAARIPGARFAEIDSGHLMAWQSPAALARLVVDFVEAA